MKIMKRIVEELIQEAHIHKPVEACGYLGTKNNVISVIYPMTNMDNSPEHFFFNPEEQFKVVKEARKLGQKLTACYHSHPQTPARMSDEDIRLACDPDMYYLIYSIPENELKAFQVGINKKSEEITMEVLE